MNDNEITLTKDGYTPEMYEIGATLNVKATADGHAEKEQDYTIKDELNAEKNALDLTLDKNTVKFLSIK